MLKPVGYTKKPWGIELLYVHNGNYAGKILCIEEGHRLSLQKHEVKSETMCIVGGDGVFELNGDTWDVTVGDIIDIKAGDVHRITAKTYLTIAETSTPELDDVVRLEDDYGRVQSASKNEKVTK